MVLQAKRVLTAKKVKALSFDGVNDYVSIPDSTYLNLTTFSLIAIVKTKYNGTGYVRIFSRNANTLSWPLNPYQLAISNAGKATIIIGNGTSFEKTYDFGPVNDNKWHVIEGAVTGSELQLYVDGVLRESATQNITPYIYTGNAALAKASSKYFPGIIHTILLYNKPLTDKQRIKLLQNPYNPPLSGCVLWLSPESIDESAGVWKDQSGNGNNGTIYGAQAIEMNKLAFSVKSPSRVLGAV